MNAYTHHYERRLPIPARAETVFAYLDDHSRLSAHMSKSSWMMGGGKMEMATDGGKGQRVGSHIRLSGRAFGIPIFLDEVVTRHEFPRAKEWETVGPLNLLVIGNYRMAFELTPRQTDSILRISIDYELPANHPLIGRLFAGGYAAWCVRRMLNDARAHFSSPRARSA